MTKVYFSIIFLVRIYLIFYEDEFFKFHENIVLAIILKQPYFWVRKVGMFFPRTLKYCVGVQRSQSYLMG